MLIMVITAILFAISTIRMERHAIVSPLLSDRDKAITWSFSIVNTMAMPFVFIALTVMISEVPGVREMAGDWFVPLLRLIGF
jgi:flagellar biosynthesis protein FliR